MTASARPRWAGQQGQQDPGHRGARPPALALHVEFPGRRGRRAAPARTGKPRLGATLPAPGPGGAGEDRSRLSRGLRRAADVLGSAALLLFTLPVLLAIAALLLLEGAGPVLCQEERIGLDGKPFRLLRFRSARGDGPAGPGGARTTRPGHWLRQAGLDELPCLLNVLRGDMSLVGPYPEPPHRAALLSAQLPLYAVRHAVKPGIVGWAQVADPYGASAADARTLLGYDLHYVLHQGWRLDLRILLAAAGIALRSLLRGPGAR